MDRLTEVTAALEEFGTETGGAAIFSTKPSVRAASCTEVRLSVSVSSEADTKRESDDGAVIVAAIRQRYSWTVSQSSSTGLVQSVGWSIEEVVRRTGELSSRLLAVVAEPYYATSDKTSSEILRIRDEAKTMQRMALDRLKLLRLENEQLFDNNPEQDLLAIIRNNLQSHYSVQLRAALNGFDAASRAYNAMVEQQSRRQLKQVGVNDEKQIERIIDSGQTQSVLTAATSGDLLDAVNGLEQRHTAILQIERQVTELNQIFHDLNDLVERQQEHIDNITIHVQNTEARVRRAHKNLTKGQEHHAKSRKAQCCILAIVITALTVIVIPSVLRSSTSTST
jgi:t-SNARE complex subunit (syntaxin)